MASACRRFVPLLKSVCRFSTINRLAAITSKNGITAYSSNVSACRKFGSTMPRIQKETVKLTFLLGDGSRQLVDAKVGDNLLDVITENEIDLDGFGACEGTLACSTCHLIFKQEDYKKLPETPTDEELDMLDLAYGLTDTSRLGCQVIVSKEMENWEITVPGGVADARDV
ncbi:hypothetical protein LSH36_306g03068 [Paralvinella palmiformis]|uniref:2Fe-2S ferredoxin-type domain-containing protein n=1 Tax=Paralvinella palmiformis TaxID=53620 RepID=A0AAD9N2K3_9ANNE|nr:hypothetical protein LSH36_306g03068 [Paralvinella palmiformis]